MPKVSVIMPSLNVAAFIHECIDSAIHQTLQDIEIICVDAGSTDGTAEILQEYAEKDSRITFIHSDVKSYGYQMNLGLDAAKGEYIGILETDDWVDPDMYESLWQAAKDADADFVKSNYYWYTTTPDINSQPFENLRYCPYDRVFSPLDETRLFRITPSIWSGIYRREMLLENRIRFNETPGASFQDTSFHFMVCTVSRRCRLLNRCFLHYRRDNAGSSVHSKGKVFCVSDEMHYFEEFLEAHPAEREKLLYFYPVLKFDKYRWNFARLDAESRQDFLQLMHREFSAIRDASLLQEQYFTPANWDAVNLMLRHPKRFYRKSLQDAKPADSLLGLFTETAYAHGLSRALRRIAHELMKK